MTNQLNLIFGPSLPVQFESVGLTFISNPIMTSDSSVASLSAARYAPENYPNVDTITIYSNSASGVMNLNINYGTTTFNGRIGATTLPNYSGSILLTGDLTFDMLDSPIYVTGLRITEANTWCPVIQSGTVYRLYTLTATEPASSWLRMSGLNNGDTVLLAYAVPEYTYQQTVNVNTTFPPNPAQFVPVTEIVSPIASNQLSYDGYVNAITTILRNGVVVYSGLWVPNQTDPTILSIDQNAKIITLNASFVATDIVELTYLSYNSTYTYSGYRDINNVWYPFNANPEYGNLIGDSQMMSLRPSADCLLEQCTIYAYPCAYLDIRPSNLTGSNTANGFLGNFNMTWVRAIDYGETHFIRHLINGDGNEEIQILAGSGTNSTWGTAKFNRNYYDELGTYTTDVYSDLIPSMLPLGKILLSAPVATSNVVAADIRQRGGGIPTSTDLPQIQSELTGIEYLRSFLDVATWEGQALKVGGVVEIQIDSSLLKLNPADPNPNTFTYSEIDNIVSANIPPGIKYVINFGSI